MLKLREAAVEVASSGGSGSGGQFANIPETGEEGRGDLASLVLPCSGSFSFSSSSFLTLISGVDEGFGETSFLSSVGFGEGTGGPAVAAGTLCSSFCRGVTFGWPVFSYSSRFSMVDGGLLKL